MILVTGGTGFVGRAVVAELVSNGYRVKVLSRRPPSRRDVEWAEGDVTDPASVERAVSGCRQVIHLVAIRREWKERTFQAITAGGTLNTVSAASKTGGVDRFILMSALGVGPDPDTGYMSAKLQAEEMVRSSGIPHAIMRPSFIIGPGGFMEEYAQLIRSAPMVPIPGQGNFALQPIALDDVARAFRKAIETPAALGNTYDLVGLEPTTFEALIDLIMNSMGMKKRKIHVPLPIMRVVGSVSQRLTPNPPVTVDEIKMLLAGNTGDPGPSQRDLGLDLIPLARAVQEAVDGLRL